MGEEQSPKRSKTSESQLTQLSKLTTIVADTGEVDAIKKYNPQGIN